jgi:hypothetical protein
MWYYEQKEFTETPTNFAGFVYCITDLSNGRKYIGKKLFTRSKVLPKNSKRARRSRQTVDSDWRTYCGSSKQVQELVEKYGLDRFKREIIRLCRTKGEMSYYEAKEQFDREVLFSDEYYNEFIGCKIHAKHVRKSVQTNLSADKG